MIFHDKLPHEQPLILKFSSRQVNGAPVDSDYPDNCWLWLIGPSSLCLLKLMVKLLKEREPYKVAGSQLGKIAGLSGTLDTKKSLSRTLLRLERFGFIEITSNLEGIEIKIAKSLRFLSCEQLKRAPEEIRTWHTQLIQSF